MKLGDEYKLYSHDSCIATTQESPHKRLSKQNCDEIFRVVDVETLSDEYSHDSIWFNKRGDYNNQEFFEFIAKKSFTDGFNKAMELNKDKFFTVEDLYRALLINAAGNNTTLRNFFEQTVLPMFEQPTEIEVEIEMEKYGYCEGCRKAGMWHCAHADTCGYSETRERPKLDENGCLILKKK
jgi:hypothetical protein